MKKSLTIFVLALFSFSLLLADITTQNTNPVTVGDLTQYQTRDLLYDQISDPASEGGITAQDFETSFDAYDAEGADEFAVPADGWTVNQVMVLGTYSADGGPCDLANVRFYADDAGMPGELLYEYLEVAANPDVDGNLDIMIPNTFMPEGTYWVSVQGRQDYGAAGQWYWGKQESPTIGVMFHWRNPGDGFGGGNIDWVPATTQWPDYEDLNLAFSLYGTVGGTEPGLYPLSEDFEGGVIPDGWTMTTNSAIGWFVTQDGSSQYWAVPTGDGYYACSNDDAANDDGSLDYLITPVMDFSTAVAPVLTFDSFFGGNYGQLATVSATTDGGATWDLLLDVPTDAGWLGVELDLSAYAGLPEVWLLFHSDDAGTWASGWALDNVVVDEGAQDPLPFTENFEGGVIPDGWTMTTLSAIGWFITQDGSSQYWTIPAGDGYYACSNDDAANDDSSMDYLITPPLDLSGYDGVGLTFDSFYSGAYSEIATVEVSTDGGTTWDVVSTVPIATVWQNVFVSLSAYAGMPEVWVAFHADDSGVWSSGWAFDNVVIDELLTGSVVGVVTDAVTTDPIEGATITVGTITGTSLADGSYTVAGVPEGTYEVSCTAAGYFPTSVMDVMVEAGQEVVLDFALDVLVGDTIEDPIYVEWAGTSYTDSGTTTIYNDDYDIYGSDNNDVIYEFTLDLDTMVDISLLGSDYDTKLAVYEFGVIPGPDNYLFYNDDYSGRGELIADKKTANRVLQSALYDMELTAGTYVAVVDGYGTSAGNYVIDMFFDPVSIYDIQYTEDAGDGTYPSPMIGETVVVTGVLTATDGESKFWLHDAEGPWNGIYLYSFDLDPIPEVGDEITVTAEVDEYYGLTELLNVTAYNLNSSGNALLGPAVVATGSVDESYEGVYSQFLVATCTAEADTYGEALLNDGSGDGKTDDVLYDFEPVLDDVYNVTGVVTYSFSEYKLLPRDMGDIEDLSNELLWPPLDLTYQIVDDDVMLDWMAPTQYGWNTYYPGPLQYLSYATPERATMYDVTDFGFTYPMDLSAVSHFFYESANWPWEGDTDFTFKIYDTDGSTILYESPVITAVPYPNEVVHEFTPITVTDNFWVSIAPVNAESGVPYSLGYGENTNGYSGGPGAWELDLEWYTGVYIMGDGAPARISPTFFTEKETVSSRNNDNSALIDDVPDNANQLSRGLLGFNVFRDDVMLNTELVADSFYDDLDLAPGTYDYYVTAVWHMGESDPSNEVTAVLAYGDLEGTVTDIFSGDPIEGAEVVAGAYTATTATDGTYLIEDMLIGTYEVLCSAEGYQDDVATVDIMEDQVTVQDFALSMTAPDPPENVYVDPMTWLCTWSPPGGSIANDDFESYTVGEFLAVQSDLWTTWSDNPGSGEDALVTDAQALSGTNSIVIEGSTDLVLIMENYTAGVYVVEINMYVPTGHSGYYNLQKTNTPGEEWAFQITFDTDGVATGDAAAAGAINFNYDQDTWMNLKVMVDLDTDYAEFYYNDEFVIGYQWTLGTFGEEGLLSLGGMNIFASGGDPLAYVDDVNFRPYSEERDLTGYNVYLDDVMLVSDIVDLQYQFSGLVAGTEYTAGVQAVYDEGLSDIATYTFIAESLPIIPPSNLMGEVQDYNDVMLTWEAPAGAGEWVRYDDGTNFNAIGLGGGTPPYVFSAASKWEPADLAEYDGATISKIQFFPNEDADFTLKIWTGPNAEEVYSQVVTEYTVEEFTDIILDVPYTIDASTELWFGYEVSHDEGFHPAGTDPGPAVAGYGDLVSQDGGATWDPLSGFGLDYNWNLAIYVEGSGGAVALSKSNSISTPKTLVNNTRSSDLKFSVKATAGTVSSNGSEELDRILIGYNIYADGEMVGTVADDEMEYLVEGLDSGEHEFYVTAVYDNGESDPSNIVTLTIVLPAPTNFNAISQGAVGNILCTWSAPAADRGLTGYKIYRDDVEVGTATGLFFVDTGVPTGTYVYHATAVYSDMYESEASNQIEVDHVGSTDNMIPLVTELTGNYPNPFNPTTQIKFAISEASEVNLEIYNIRGEKVRTLVNGYREAAFYTEVWDGTDDDLRNVSSGVYFYKMKAGRYTSTKKMILMK